MKKEKYDEIDLHLFHPKDVKEIVPLFLEENFLKQTDKVKIITGKGKGVLRNIVLNILKTSKYVDYFYQAPAYESHWGAFYVKIKKNKNFTN